jgi:hypothetical protein
METINLIRNIHDDFSRGWQRTEKKRKLRKAKEGEKSSLLPLDDKQADYDDEGPSEVVVKTKSNGWYSS